MPSILVGASQCNEQMWQALKTHIMRERQRKKQEADEEEERLRKERERQQKQVVMTFGETQEQITNLQNEISKLETEKHDLFTELKRVLYEEGTRKQFAKENNMCSEVLTVGGYSTVNIKVTHPQLLPTARNTSPLYESNVVEPQVLTTGSSKRIFSPPPIPSTSYNSYYKPPPCISSYNPPSSCKPKEAVRLSNYPRELMKIENSIGPSKKNYGYSSIMSQLSRETPEQSKPTYLAGAYVTHIQSMERRNSTYDEEKHYLRLDESTIHSILIPQSRQGTKANGTATDFPVQASAAIPNQPSPHTPAVTYDDTSQITLSRILHNTPYQVPMAYRKALGYS